MRPSSNELHDLFRYVDGRLYWLVGQRRGEEAAWCSSRKNVPSLRLTIRSIQYRLSHVIWCMFNGEWPIDQIDHINGNPLDNRIENLRPVSNAENQRNAARRVDNKSGVVGVRWNSLECRWKAFIQFNGQRVNLGTFRVQSDAIAARKLAEEEYGYHPNHGRPKQMLPRRVRLLACQADRGE